jgi:hypothetical protein
VPEPKVKKIRNALRANLPKALSGSEAYKMLKEKCLKRKPTFKGEKTEESEKRG